MRTFQSVLTDGACRNCAGVGRLFTRATPVTKEGRKVGPTEERMVGCRDCGGTGLRAVA